MAKWAEFFKVSTSGYYEWLRTKQERDELGIDSIHNRHKRRCLTNSKKARDDKYKNLVREKVITKPFEVIASDISYIRSKEGFVYTCIIKDVKSGIILASNESDNIKKELVTDTIKATIKRWNLGEETIFHSDRGSQVRQEVA